MKKIVLTCIISSTSLFGVLSCDDAEKSIAYSPDFVWETAQDNPHQINFINRSVGDYLYIEWDYGNGSRSGVQSDKTYQGSAYYPLKGNYEIKMTVWGKNNVLSDTKTITKVVSIETDDPDYQAPEEDLIWSDEFDGKSINEQNWTFETGASGWGNQELQNYTAGDNAHIEAGRLIITARKIDDKQSAGSYTSTRMISRSKQEFTYGRIEVRAKLPSGTGIWPAIWMLGSNIGAVGWPACGEIDIMEYVGYQPNIIHSTVHTSSGYAGNGHGDKKILETAEEEFHIYGLLWTETSLTFYVDSPENVTHVYAPTVKNEITWPFDESHFFILNVAIGGLWGGIQGIDDAIFPQTMEVDYVRVYEL